jgi:23S rRNA (cytidine1920-2'-O)/16S rRNA (cytidine1409-2'-O)-methyltransferase
MLRNGASKVIAIDVGYGQIAWKLRNDPRVIVMDRTNIRYVRKPDLSCVADFAAVDVSFISLKLVIPVVIELLGDEGEMVCLVKPQFEAGRGSVGKKGVVRDEGTHFQVLKDISEFSARCGLTVKGFTYSPIKGAEGNIEYLLYVSKAGGGKSLSGEGIRNLVNEAHSILK